MSREVARHLQTRSRSGSVASACLGANEGDSSHSSWVERDAGGVVGGRGGGGAENEIGAEN